MHLIMAPAVIAGLLAKLRIRKLQKDLTTVNEKPELALVIQSIQDNIQASGSISVEKESQTTKTAS